MKNKKALKLISYLTMTLFAFSFVEVVPQAYSEDKPLKNPPLVLGIPGFLVPHVPLTQEQHFGQAKELLAQEGIPFEVIVYDSKEYPLNFKNDIASYQDYSIAFSRVGPAILKAIETEKTHRLLNNQPPLKEVVLYMYSQGGVITYSFVRKFYYWKKMYQHWVEEYGREWEILRKDPEFIYLSEAMTNFHATYAVLAQREENIHEDKNLQKLIDEGMQHLNARIDNLLTYLHSPEKLYEHVNSYDSPFYPKRYRKFSELAQSISETRGRNQEIFDFIMDYSIFKDILNIEFSYFTGAASFFGSPQANAYYGLLKIQPIRGFISVSEKDLTQIRDTRLGSGHHGKKLSALARESQLGSFLLNDKNVLFVVGANGSHGDGLVEQPSAHLSGHRFMEFDIAQWHKADRGDDEMLQTGEIVTLPDWPKLALPIKHFKEEGLGKDYYGAAYMEAGNPVYQALLDFIYKDFEKIEEIRQRQGVPLTQFLVEFFVEQGAQTPQVREGIPFFVIPFQLIGGVLKSLLFFVNTSPIQHVHKPEGISLDATFFNEDAETYVWLGHFSDELLSRGQTDLALEFEATFPGLRSAKIEVPIKAGTISFVKIIATDEPAEEIASE